MKLLTRTLLGMAIVAALCGFVSAQKRGGAKATPRTKQQTAQLPAVKEIDIEGLKAVLKPDGRPRLINFWATWCDPCREEFPDLVKLDTTYKGKIDFYTVSLDDVVDISDAVPKFLSKMNSTMPAFLLHTADEDAAITLISKDFHGNLPFTILLTANGDLIYSKEGKIKPLMMTDEINKLLTPAQ